MKIADFIIQRTNVHKITDNSFLLTDNNSSVTIRVPANVVGAHFRKVESRQSKSQPNPFNPPETKIESKIFDYVLTTGQTQSFVLIENVKEGENVDATVTLMQWREKDLKTGEETVKTPDTDTKDLATVTTTGQSIAEALATAVGWIFAGLAVAMAGYVVYRVYRKARHGEELFPRLNTIMKKVG